MPRPATERAEILPALAEVFREHGFDGASLALIAARTGLGKGSLYHFFPGGKEEMADAVLDEIGGWFETRMFRPLREEPDAVAAIRASLADTDAYFRSGRRVCLVGVLALGEVRDRFAERIRSYFQAWRDALAVALVRAGRPDDVAADQAEETIAAIQGGLVAARALQDIEVFARMLARLERRLLPSPREER